MHRLGIMVLIVSILAGWVGFGCASEPWYTFQVVKGFPHDPGAFTQGLAYADGYIYEGTGMYGRSTLRKVRLEDGKVLRSVALDERYFGEGITLFQDRIMQLTWREGRGFVYDKESFTLIDDFPISTEGWGLTNDGIHLIMSDGSATLTYLDPFTFQPIKQIAVFDSAGPVVRLNELEYIQGEIYANVWLTDSIARINPSSGRVTGWIDLSGLLGPEDREGYNVDVLNGIAYDAENERIFVTGKLWPALFEVILIPLP